MSSEILSTTTGRPTKILYKNIWINEWMTVRQSFKLIRSTALKYAIYNFLIVTCSNTVSILYQTFQKWCKLQKIVVSQLNQCTTAQGSTTAHELSQFPWTPICWYTNLHAARISDASLIRGIAYSILLGYWPGIARRWIGAGGAKHMSMNRS